jgi:DNA-binding LacI/PurR family transcriptional regulator
LGYSPDPVASNLKTRRTGCIGILIPQPIPPIARNPHTLDFLEGVGETCHDAGLSLMLIPPLKGNLRRAIVRAAVDGFLTMGLETFRGTMVVLQQRAMPFVMVDSEPTPGIPCVNIDDEAGAYAAMAYTLNMGHRHIAILGIRSGHHGNYREYVGTLQRRINGYLRALEEEGLTIDTHNVHLAECDCEAEGGYEAFQTLWHGRWKPTAIVAMADIIAIGVLHAARDLRIQIPDDVSLIGYDDIAASRLTYPALTTVRQPTFEKGRIAARLLVDLIGGQPVESEHVILPVELVERDSFRLMK